MTEEQTLAIYSGHPLGYVTHLFTPYLNVAFVSLFPSSKEAPRVVITNGMVNFLPLVFHDSKTPNKKYRSFQIIPQKKSILLCSFIL